MRCPGHRSSASGGNGAPATETLVDRPDPRIWRVNVCTEAAVAMLPGETPARCTVGSRRAFSWTRPHPVQGPGRQPTLAFLYVPTRSGIDSSRDVLQHAVKPV